MSIESDLFTALAPLVGNRCYPLTFVQPSGALPAWPAIRYTFISADATPDVCGTSDPDTDDVRVQVDAVASTYTAMRALRLAVIAALAPSATPTLRDGEGESFEEATRTYRARLDFVLYPSSL